MYHDYGLISYYFSILSLISNPKFLATNQIWQGLYYQVLVFLF
jgi:hypothetical protein